MEDLKNTSSDITMGLYLIYSKNPTAVSFYYRLCLFSDLTEFLFISTAIRLILKISKRFDTVTCAIKTVSSITWLAKTSKGSFGIVTVRVICTTIMLSCFTLVYVCEMKIINRTQIDLIHFQVRFMSDG